MIEQVIEKLQTLRSSEDILQKVDIWSYQQAVEIFKIIAGVLDFDIEYAEDYVEDDDDADGSGITCQETRMYCKCQSA